MEPLKTRGLQDIAALTRRVRRQRAMSRIDRIDCEYLETRLREMEARIISMKEHDKNQEEVDDGNF